MDLALKIIGKAEILKCNDNIIASVLSVKKNTHVAMVRVFTHHDFKSLSTNLSEK
jgi:hypothetical protein